MQGLGKHSAQASQGAALIHAKTNECRNLRAEVPMRARERSDLELTHNRVMGESSGALQAITLKTAADEAVNSGELPATKTVSTLS